MLFIFLLPFLLNAKPTITAYFGIFDDAYNITISHPQYIPWKLFDKIIVSFTILKDGIMVNERDTDDTNIRHIFSLYKQAKPNGSISISLYGEHDGPFVNASDHPIIFANSVLNYLKKYNLNGFDLDWETFAINAYPNELVRLLGSCHKVFRNSYLLSHAIWPGVHYPNTIGLIANITHEINIMTYGLGANYIEALINQYNESGYPYEKMVLGIETERGTETKDTIRDKLDLVNKYGLKGLFIWRLDNDGIYENEPRFSTTQMLYEVMNEID
jgi:hypothetical protein